MRSIELKAPMSIQEFRALRGKITVKLQRIFGANYKEAEHGENSKA